MTKSTNDTSDTTEHQLQCLEVWGGSSFADHSASVPGLDISVSSRPIDELGGDLYLISSCASGWTSRILLADVSGHGASVSDLSFKLRKAMHKSINTVDQSKIARSLNSTFDEISEDGKFATALLMTYFAPSGHLIMVNAGHPPPLLCRAGTNDWVEVDEQLDGVLTIPTPELRVGIKNLPLGVIDSTEYEQIAIKFNSGDRFCAFTDGYIEAMKENSQLLGVSGLKEVLTQVLSESDLSRSIDISNMMRDAITQRGYQLADDDHTMLTLVHNGQTKPNVGIGTLLRLMKNGLGLGHIDSSVEA
jgi:phosphoserine phosphatase RsbU/P